MAISDSHDTPVGDVGSIDLGEVHEFMSYTQLEHWFEDIESVIAIRTDSQYSALLQWRANNALLSIRNMVYSHDCGH